MITGAASHSSKPLGATPIGLGVGSETTHTRTDDTAKSEFAAMLSAMMHQTPVAPAPTRLTVEALADATPTDESAIESDDESTLANEATGGNETVTTATTAIGADVTASTAGLDPDFSARLDRVLKRMREAGHTVEVRETVRSTERQEALYAQGRTTSGPVVTWTLDSRHLEGKAADVIVDGRASGKAYALLHRIAQEEGLRTLGARDPGHLELPRTTVDAREGAAARRGNSDMVVRPLRQGGILAAPAQVAQVAQVAVTARVAVPGQSEGALRRTRGTEIAGSTPSGNAPAGSQGASRQGAIRSGIAIEGATITSGSDAGVGGVFGNGRASASVNSGERALAERAVRGAADDQPRSTTNNAANAAPMAVAQAAARSAIARAASVVSRSLDASSAARANERSAARGAITASDPILATVPTDGTGATIADGAGDGASGGAADDAARDRTNAERDRIPLDRRESRDAGDARTVRQARGRTAAALSAFANEVTARSTFDPMRESTALTGARMGNLGAGAPVLRTSGLAAERVAELLAARDAQPAGTLGELRLAMDPVRDGLSEVRLALQNGGLDATLRTGDAALARGLQSEVATLTRSLERQGFDAARVSVQLEAAQQARATALDTVAASEATARGRGVRGDSDASLEGRDQQTAPGSGREQSREQQREQQHARQFSARRQRPF